MTLPSVEERKWLGRYLRKLIEKMGSERFLCAPILLPSPRYFPDRWDGAVADVHRLTQRLMHHAGLGDLGFTLSGFDDGASEIFDSGTAGWYAGTVENECCLFGVHVDQLDDPEKAVGVMAHEVAHAFRDHHKLMNREARDREELLTDLTTIYLGFGVFTTNNTDRYRSSGGYDYTEWSNAKGGYLPPPAMSWLLALQAAARGDPGEIKAIARDLEPNQQAQFKDAIEEIERDPSWLAELNLPAARPERWPYKPIAVREPDEEEAFEPEEEEEDPQRNAGVTVYRLRKGSVFERMLVAIWPGGLAGLLLGMIVFGALETWKIVASLVAGAVIGGIWITARTLHYVCSASDCGEQVTREMAVCPGCGGALAGNITESQLRVVREEELERLASEEYDDFEECAQCAPEEPCARHAS
jgi:hypothetical protein